MPTGSVGRELTAVEYGNSGLKNLDGLIADVSKVQILKYLDISKLGDLGAPNHVNMRPWASQVGS